ncbi:putative membrane protein [Smittium mucronatum]|uniref:Putative membrane protein n=1 Tax=Smittium mucronatum TaxID=133383 RepID=A0A1R0GP12_9FUNG|nr:putative membrane protein [Smittium mucronatum]
MSVILPDLPTPMGLKPDAAKFGKESFHDLINNNSLKEPSIDSFIPTKRISSQGKAATSYNRIKLAPNDLLSLDTSSSAYRCSDIPSPEFPTPNTNPSDSKFLSMFKSKKESLSPVNEGYSPLHADIVSFNNNKNYLDSETLSMAPSNSGESKNSRSTNSLSETHIVPLRSSEYSSNSDSNIHNENPKENHTMQLMQIENTRIIRAKRQETLSLSTSILTDKQKIAYVGLVYLVLVEMQANLGVQYKEAVSSTTSFMKFSKRVMDKIYAHISINNEEQKMIEQLPRHNILPDAMAVFLRSEGETVKVKTENQMTVSHAFSSSDTVPLSKSKSNNDVYSLKSPTINQPKSLTSLPSLTSSHLSPIPIQESDVLDDIKEEFTVLPASASLNVDISATLMVDLLLLLLSDEIFDSRGRFLLRRVGESLNYSNKQILLTERRVSKQLSLFDYASEVMEETEKNSNSHSKGNKKQSLAKRIAIVGLATVGGGLVIGLSAGLLAPAIGAGIGATLGAVGIANAGAFFGSIGGSVLITTGGVLTGGGLAGVKISRRIRNVDQMRLISHIDNKSTNVVFTVPGWIRSPLFNGSGSSNKSDDGNDEVNLPFELLDPINGDIFSLIWDEKALLEVGASFKLLASELASTTVMQTLQYTVLPNLLGPLSIPMWLTKLTYILDNPWSTGYDLAEKAGPIFADALFHRVQGCRPVTLIGFSLGGLLIFECLKEMGRLMAFGIVEDVLIFGAPIVASEHDWRLAHSAVGGRFINGYSSKDWMLKLMYRTANIGSKKIAGLQEISGICGLENVDFTEDVSSHMAYFKKMPLLMKKMGYDVTRIEMDIYEDDEEVGLESNGLGLINNDQLFDKTSGELPANTIITESEMERDLAINSILDGDVNKQEGASFGEKLKQGTFSSSLNEKNKKMPNGIERSNSKTMNMFSKLFKFKGSESTKSNESLRMNDNRPRIKCNKMEEQSIEAIKSEFEKFGYSFKELDSSMSTLIISKDEEK